jgi:hypothetical protein
LWSYITGALLFFAPAAFTLYQNSRVAVLWDLSFLLDTAFRFTLHQVPYRDLPFPYAPLTFLLHAGLIEIFGRVYYPHLVYAALAAGLSTLLAWRILLTILHPIPRSWAFATLLAAPLTVLSIHGIYPHPIYDSDTILAVLLAVYLLLKSPSRPGLAALTGAACVLPLFFKQNIGLPFLLATALAVVALAMTRRRRHQPIAPQLWLLAGTLIALAAALATIQLTVGLGNYLHWTIAFAAQRRLPGLATIVGIYREPSLLWTLPTTLAALILLKKPGSRFIARFPAMDGMRYPLAIFLLTAPFLWTVACLFRTDDPSDRAAQLLALWPHILLLAAAVALWNLRPANLRADPTLTPFLPLILLAAIHGTFLSQQLWGSTYALWPLLTLLLAVLLLEVRTVALPLAFVVAATFLGCGGLYALSLDRLTYIHMDPATDGPLARATLPALRGMATPGPYIPAFEELVRYADASIPPDDAILLLPGEDPFYFATGRTPAFPFLIFDPATDPFTPQQTLAEARARNIRWLIVTRNTQLTGPPHPDLPEITRTLLQDFTLTHSLTNYDIYRRK